METPTCWLCGKEHANCNVTVTGNMYWLCIKCFRKIIMKRWKHMNKKPISH